MAPFKLYLGKHVYKIALPIKKSLNGPSILKCTKCRAIKPVGGGILKFEGNWALWVGPSPPHLRGFGPTNKNSATSLSRNGDEIKFWKTGCLIWFDGWRGKVILERPMKENGFWRLGTCRAKFQSFSKLSELITIPPQNLVGYEAMFCITQPLQIFSRTW